MNIGIDLDGVLFDTENYFRTLATIYNIEKFHAIEVDREEIYFQKRYNWSRQQELEFYYDCYEDIENEAPFMPYALLVLSKLREMGHKLFIVTARGRTFEHELEITMKRFKEKNLEFDGYFFALTDKAEVCKNNSIDLMIDDLYDHIEKISAQGIKCLYFRDLVLKRFGEENKFVHEVRNWAEIYDEVLHIDNWKTGEE